MILLTGIFHVDDIDELESVNSRIAKTCRIDLCMYIYLCMYSNSASIIRLISTISISIFKMIIWIFNMD